MKNTSRKYLIRMRGDLACFTGPSKVERDSYPVITPSAARGIIDAIFWKPAIRWVIHRVYVVNRIKFLAFRRSELAGRLRPGGRMGDIKRDLRTTRALKDVDYIVEASFYMTDRAGERDSVRKFEEMFEKRMAIGQSHWTPYFGCREFPADVELFEGDPFTVANPKVDMYVGTMVHDFQSRESNDYNMFEADIREGVMDIPTMEAVC